MAKKLPRYVWELCERRTPGSIAFGAAPSLRWACAAIIAAERAAMQHEKKNGIKFDEAMRRMTNRCFRISQDDHALMEGPCCSLPSDASELTEFLASLAGGVDANS